MFPACGRVLGGKWWMWTEETAKLQQKMYKFLNSDGLHPKPSSISTDLIKTVQICLY